MDRQKTVLYLQYSNPGGYPPIIQSSHIFANAGWRVHHLGLKGWGSQGLSMPEHPNIKVNQLDTPTLTRAGRLQSLYEFSREALKLARLLKPDLLYLSDPSVTPTGLLLKAFTDIPTFYHEHDAIPPEGTLFNRLINRSRGLIGTTADLAIFPNQNRKRLFTNIHGECHRSAIVFNCPSSTEVQLTTAKSSDELIIYYHGTLVPERIPLTLLDALAQLPKDIKFQFVGYETAGSKGFLKQILDKAAELGIADRVHYLGKMSRRELLEACENASLGLSILPADSQDDNERTMAGASCKAFDYLSRKVPLLINDIHEWRELFGEYSYTCNPLSAESFQEKILYCYQNREELCATGKAGQKRILNDWNYEFQFTKALDIAERIAHG